MASPEVTRWRAVPGILAPVPGQPARHGMSASYVGRAWDQAAWEAGERDNEKLYPPSADQNVAFYRADGVATVSQLLRMAKDGDIAPADDVTAKWGGFTVAPQPPVDSLTAVNASASPASPVTTRGKRTASAEESK